MDIRMPIGRDDFEDVRSGRYYFVDKTGFLATFLKNHAKVTLFTRPRRFGKTLTLSMMRYFLDLEHGEEHRKLFDGLAITGDEEAMKMQGQYPVLFLTMKGWKGLSWDVLQIRARQQIGDLFSEHDFLLQDELRERDRQKFQAILEDKGDFAALTDSLAFLSRLLEAHYGRKPVLLLDEYDAPIQSAWEHGYYDEAMDFFREFYSAVLKTNMSLEFAVLTGVLRITKENIFSALNNLEVDSVLRLHYPEAFGFTTAEVQKMVHDFDCEDKLSELQRWYDGYRFSGQEIYNPWSVVNYFHQGCKPLTYWVNTSGNSILGEMLHRSRSQVLDKFETVLQGGSIISRVREDIIYKEIYRNESALYTMLVTTGYLTTKRMIDDELGQQAELILPNRELRSLFRIEVMERYRSDDMDIELEDLMRAFASGDIETVRDGLSQYLEVLTSSFDAQKGKEAFYHGFVLGLTATLTGDYQIRSNRETGYGCYDVAAFPRIAGRSGIIIECKYAETENNLAAKVQEALQQIEERDYDAEFRAQGVEHVLHYGMAFCGKRVQVELA